MLPLIVIAILIVIIVIIVIIVTIIVFIITTDNLKPAVAGQVILAVRSRDLGWSQTRCCYIA